MRLCFFTKTDYADQIVAEQMKPAQAVVVLIVLLLQSDEHCYLNGGAVAIIYYGP